jgi:predicted dehydrogenase
LSSIIRLGFVGVGSMGQAAHLRNYVNLPDVQVAAIAEIRPKLGKLVADRYGVSALYTSAASMLNNEQLDGIVAIQDFRNHGSIIPQLYQKGIPILTEKPLAGSVAVGETMLDSLKQSGSWHMVAYHKRSDPATTYARKEIDHFKTTGELGRLRYVRILMPAGDWIASGFTDLVHSDDHLPDIRHDPPAQDMSGEEYNAYIEFVNYYIHQVNLMRFLLSEPYTVSYADPSGVMFAVHSDSGVAGTIEMSPYRTSIDWQESALIAFERGYIKLNLPAPLAYNRPGSVEIFRDPEGSEPPATIVPQLPWIHAMRQQAMNFVSAIRGEIKPPCDAAEALQDLEIARQYLQVKGK